ncbi:MAG: hypothetical protein ACQEQC_07835 [Elusimicrobiota bacterium]
MKKEFFFMLGRPGCGKSFLYKNVFKPVFSQKGVDEIVRIDDFPILQKLLDEDTKFERHVRKEGGFEVTDWTIVDDVLKEMDEILKEKEKDGRKIFTEFARDNYREAVENFSDYVRKRGVLIYIWSPFEVCMESNRSRFEDEDKNHETDDHIVPTSLMEGYYKTDDLEDLYDKNSDSLKKRVEGWDLIIFPNPDHSEKIKDKRLRFKEAMEEVEL